MDQDSPLFNSDENPPVDPSEDADAITLEVQDAVMGQDTETETDNG